MTETGGVQFEAQKLAGVLHEVEPREEVQAQHLSWNLEMHSLFQTEFAFPPHRLGEI